MLNINVTAWMRTFCHCSSFGPLLSCNFFTYKFSILKKKCLNGCSRAEAFFSKNEKNVFSDSCVETQKIFYRSILNHRRYIMATELKTSRLHRFYPVIIESQDSNRPWTSSDSSIYSTFAIVPSTKMQPSPCCCCC